MYRHTHALMMLAGVGCLFVGDDLTGALHDLQLQLSPPVPSYGMVWYSRV